jgi:hypothetical protein
VTEDGSRATLASVLGRRARDAAAYRVWQQVETWVDPVVLPSAHAESNNLLAGQVARLQTYRRGSKAFVHFGCHLGYQDTW